MFNRVHYPSIFYIIAIVLIVAFNWVLAIDSLPTETDANKTEEDTEAVYPISIVPMDEDPDYQHLMEKRIIPVLPHHEWFKDSLLNLPQDLAEARQQNKGLILYFGQYECTYCEALLNVTLSKPDVVAYTQTYFDVIAFDIWGKLIVTTLSGEQKTEQAFAEAEQTNLTPALIFYDKLGKEALRLRGYQSPYEFRAALDYVVSGAYQQQSFSEYLARNKTLHMVNKQALHENALFTPPPHNLNRSRLASERLLAVFFEQGDCHACDILHGEVLQDTTITTGLEKLDIIQLNIWQETPVITPNGEYTTAKAWATKLGVFFTPSILFFDKQGKEIFRLDSIVHVLQLKDVLLCLVG